MSEKIAVNLPHHKSKQLCTTRTPYRQGNKLTAVKVYTITKESQHLLIFNVPSLGLESELLKFCKKFGKVSGFHLVTDYKKESLDLFTCVFHIFYADLKSSRFAKKKLDNHVFYGSSLHVCYAPELESLDETRIKLQHRRKEISLRIKMNNSGHKEFQCNSRSSVELVIGDDRMLCATTHPPKTDFKVPHFRTSKAEKNKMCPSDSNEASGIGLLNARKRPLTNLTSKIRRNENITALNQNQATPKKFMEAPMLIPRSIQAKIKFG